MAVQSGLPVIRSRRGANLRYTVARPVASPLVTSQPLSRGSAELSAYGGDQDGVFEEGFIERFGDEEDGERAQGAQRQMAGCTEGSRRLGLDGGAPEGSTRSQIDAKPHGVRWHRRAAAPASDGGGGRRLLRGEVVRAVIRLRVCVW